MLLTIVSICVQGPGKERAHEAGALRGRADAAQAGLPELAPGADWAQPGRRRCCADSASFEGPLRQCALLLKPSCT